MIVELRKEEVPHMAKFQSTLADELEKEFQLQFITACSSLVSALALTLGFGR